MAASLAARLLKGMVTNFYPPGIVVGVGRYSNMVCKQNVSHKLEMAGPFSRGDTIMNKTFFVIKFHH
jgi:hypothetical protein